ncbi:hypothetical protein ES319_A04G091900v1 [Gossypium barbadense]|uniref:Uncharacterized protein n=1 Tax=Gossypium barbadense TaxID=3634 RepID=A0A5J5W7A5_GOSBA|nr:hypothetical protein ES319_A04G091900v1 [Gossypium barbadense]
MLPLSSVTPQPSPHLFSLAPPLLLHLFHPFSLPLRPLASLSPSFFCHLPYRHLLLPPFSSSPRRHYFFLFSVSLHFFHFGRIFTYFFRSNLLRKMIFESRTGENKVSD